MHSSSEIKPASCYSIYGTSFICLSFAFYSPIPFISVVLFSVLYVVQSWRFSRELWHVHIASTTVDMFPGEHCSSRHKKFRCKVCETNLLQAARIQFNNQWPQHRKSRLLKARLRHIHTICIHHSCVLSFWITNCFIAFIGLRVRTRATEMFNDVIQGVQNTTISFTEILATLIFLSTR
jgi:hypothetical protein